MLAFIFLYKRNGHSLNINGNFILGDNETINIQKGKFIVEGNCTLSNNNYSKVNMKDEEDYMLVKGNLDVQSHHGTYGMIMTAGILEVKGDITESVAGSNFISSGTNKVVLSGEKEQKLNMSSIGRIAFATLDCSRSVGVTVLNTIDINTNIIGMEKIKGDTLNYIGNITLQKDMEIRFQNIEFYNGTINLNGYKLAVKGDLIQNDGVMNINNGRLDIVGNYTLTGSSCLYMLNDNDYICVSGNFKTESTTNHKGYLKAGILEVKGDFIQALGNSSNFAADEKHKVILSGSKEQKISFTDSENSYFRILDSSKSVGVIQLTKVTIKGADKWYISALKYIEKSGKQILLGKYTEEITLLGTAGEISLSLIGADLPADIRDLTHDVQHWEWSWKHAGETALDAIGLLPVVGVLKNGDEVALLVKNGEKTELKKIVGGFCFSGDTLIYTKNGYKRIKDVEINDEVYSEDTETGEVGLKRVEGVSVKETGTIVYITVGNKVIETTKDHPFYVKGKGWVKAGELTVGIELVTAENEVLVVEKVEVKELEEKIKVYNLNIEEWHTYFVSENRILVHNNNCAQTIEGVTQAKKLSMNEIDDLIQEIGGSIKNHPLRQEYENAVKNLSNYEVELRAKGLNEKEIAQAMHQARRDLGVKYKNLTPDALREYIYEVNMKRYDGDPLGGSFEFFENKYMGDYSKIIDGAKRPNGNVDKLLENFKKWLIEKNK